MPAIELPASQEEQKVELELLRKRIKDHHIAIGLQTKEKFQDVLAELCFLQNGGNMMEFLVWKKKPPPNYFEYVKIHPIEVQLKATETQALTFASPSTSGSQLLNQHYYINCKLLISCLHTQM